MNESELIFKFLSLIKIRKPGILIDVGAHIGNSLKQFANNGWRVFAFEPDKENFKALKNNYINNEKVVCFRNAISDSDGYIKFFISNKYWGINSIKPFDKTHSSWIKVKSIKLKTFINEHKLKKIDFLKIDIEGADYLALKGMDFSRCKPIMVMCEFMDSRSKPFFNYDHHDMVKYMDKYGYTAYIFEWSEIIGGYSEKGVNKGVTTRFVKYEKYPSKSKLYWGNVVFVRNKLAWFFDLFSNWYIKRLGL